MIQVPEFRLVVVLIRGRILILAQTPVPENSREPESRITAILIPENTVYPENRVLPGNFTCASYMWEAQAINMLKQPIVATGSAMILVSPGAGPLAPLVALAGAAVIAAGNSINVNPTTGERAMKMTDQAAISTAVSLLTLGTGVGEGMAAVAQAATVALAQSGMRYDEEGRSQGWSLKSRHGDMHGETALLNAAVAAATSYGGQQMPQGMSGMQSRLFGDMISTALNVGVEYGKQQTWGKNKSNYEALTKPDAGRLGSFLGIFAQDKINEALLEGATALGDWAQQSNEHDQSRRAFDALVGAAYDKERKKLLAVSDQGGGGVQDFLGGAGFGGLPIFGENDAVSQRCVVELKKATGGERQADFNDIALAHSAMTTPDMPEEAQKQVFLALLTAAGIVKPLGTSRAEMWQSNQMHYYQMMVAGKQAGERVQKDGSIWRETRSMGRDSVRSFNELRQWLYGQSQNRESVANWVNDGDREARLEGYLLAYKHLLKDPNGSDPIYAAAFLDGQESERTAGRVLAEGLTFVGPEAAASAAKILPALRAFMRSSRAMRTGEALTFADKAADSERIAAFAAKVRELPRFAEYELDDVQRIVRSLTDAGVSEEQTLRYLAEGVMDYKGTRIVGLPQKTGTPGHAGKSMEIAMDLAKTGEFEIIHLDRGYNSLAAPKVFAPNRRPDIMAITKWGSTLNIDSEKRLVKVVEVISRTDDPIILEARNEALRAQLSKRGLNLLVELNFP